MARAAISSAKAASFLAPLLESPSASRAAVREHKRLIAARMIASGSGTRSAVPIMVATKFMCHSLCLHDPSALGRCLQRSCVRRQRKETTGTRLIIPIALAARAQHLLFQGRDAGHMDQDPVHEDRREQARQAPGIVE